MQQTLSSHSYLQWLWFHQQFFIEYIGFRHMVILGWEPDGADLLVVPSGPWIMCKNISLQLSPGVAKAWKFELFILCLQPSHLSWCHFPSNPSSPQASEKEEKRKTGIVGKMKTEQSSPPKKKKKKNVVDLNACYHLDLSLNLVWSWCRWSRWHLWEGRRANPRIEVCAFFHYNVPLRTVTLFSPSSLFGSYFTFVYKAPFSKPITRVWAKILFSEDEWLETTKHWSGRKGRVLQVSISSMCFESGPSCMEKESSYSPH